MGCRYSPRRWSAGTRRCGAATGSAGSGPRPCSGARKKPSGAFEQMVMAHRGQRTKTVPAVRSAWGIWAPAASGDWARARGHCDEAAEAMSDHEPRGRAARPGGPGGDPGRGAATWPKRPSTSPPWKPLFWPARAAAAVCRLSARLRRDRRMRPVRRPRWPCTMWPAARAARHPMPGPSRCGSGRLEDRISPGGLARRRSPRPRCGVLRQLATDLTLQETPSMHAQLGSTVKTRGVHRRANSGVTSRAQAVQAAWARFPGLIRPI